MLWNEICFWFLVCMFTILDPQILVLYFLTDEADEKEEYGNDPQIPFCLLLYFVFTVRGLTFECNS